MSQQTINYAKRIPKMVASRYLGIIIFLDGEDVDSSLILEPSVNLDHRSGVELRLTSVSEGIMMCIADCAICFAYKLIANTEEST